MRLRAEVPRHWFKASEAAQYANEHGHSEVTVEMVRANVRLDLLRAYAIGTGHFYRIRIDDLDEWLDKHPWDREVNYVFAGGRWIAELDSEA